MWNILSKLFINLILRRKYHFKLSTESQKFPKPPFIVISNHGTFFDPWIIGKYSPHPCAYMANDDGFRGKGISQWYLRGIGAFPKKKGGSDFKAMKTTLELLKDGFPVCIFPEGQTTWDGETQLMYKGIEKLIKKSKVPLVCAKLQGNFLTKPWWAKTVRQGKIRLTLTTIKPAEIDQMSTDQLFEKITSMIYQNEIKDPKNLETQFSGTNLTSGLERLAWICMHCGEEDTLVTYNNTLECTSCKHSWEMDGHCRLKAKSPDAKSFEDLKDWIDAHKEKILSKINSDEHLITSASFTITMSKENDDLVNFTDIDTGTLQLTKSELKFTSASNTYQWPIDKVEDAVIQKQDIFEFRDENTHYRFLFSGHSPMKWVYYVRYLKGYSECEKRGYI
jgi:1-acyl-sn-glycerol-3-phosphate acyltransferase